jgi:hypothetical protein
MGAGARAISIVATHDVSTGSDGSLGATGAETSRQKR